MGRHRITLYRRETPRKLRSGRGWRELPPQTFVKAFLASSLVMASLVGVMWLVGVDFTSEYSYRKAKLCGILYQFTPEHLQSARLCVAFNLAPFAIVPGLTLVLFIRRLLRL